MSKDYIAEIVGPDEKYVLQRRFLSRFEEPTHASGNFYEESKNSTKTYFLVDETGERIEFPKESVFEAVNPTALPKITTDIPLYPFQADGAKFLATKKKALLADDMGLGKTRQALAAIQKFPVLIVCPASMKYEWEAQAQEAYPHCVITVLSGRTVFALLPFDILIINYDILDDWVAELARCNILTMIADESHYLKNSSSQRSRALRDLVFEKKYPYRYLLSGTPSVSGPQDLYSQLLIMGHLPEGFWKKNDFYREFCGGEWNGKYMEFNPSEEGLDELKGFMETCALVRTKAEVLPEIPPKAQYSFHFSEEIVSPDYSEAEENFVEWYKDLTGKNLEFNEAQAMVQMQKLLQLSEFDRANSAEFKEWMESFGSKPVVLVYRFKKTKEILQGFLGQQAYYYDGSQSSEEKQAMVDQFQNGNRQFFVGQIESMKTGITLTRSSDMVFMSLPWSQADFVQASDRIYRIGQENSVTIWNLKTDALDIDRMMEDIVLRKKSLSEAVMGS